MAFDDGMSMGYDDPRGHWPSSDDQLVACAVQFLAREQGWRFDEAIVELAQRCSSGQERHVAEIVVGALRTATKAAWDRGWQPGDLHRLAVRRCTTVQQSIVVDVMSDELARYAPATVDHRWMTQLRALGGNQWWGKEHTWLQARRAGGTDWLTALSDAVTVLFVLQMVPRIERLLPLPGQATAARSQPQQTVDDRVLERVRMMLAKAESTTFEAEAETFTAAAQKLMARHSIDTALLAADPASSHSDGTAGPQGRRIGINTPYEGPKASLLTAVARANRCRAVWSRELGFATVVGYDADLDGVELMFTSLLIQANARLMAEGKRNDRHGRSRTRSFRQSFLLAYAYRIGERLAQAAESEVESARDRAPGTRQDLVPLLAAREGKVESVMSEMFPSLRTQTVRPVRDSEGWAVGRDAADRANLTGGNPRPRVTRRAGRAR